VAAAAGAESGQALRMDLAPHRTTLHAPNRFHLVRALTRFCTRVGGPRAPCITCRGLHSGLESRPATRPFIVPVGFTPWVRIKTSCTTIHCACAAPCESFSVFFFWIFLAESIQLLLTEFCFENSRPNSVARSVTSAIACAPISVIFGLRCSSLFSCVLSRWEYSITVA
jgi:hypothetical protein